MGVREKLCKRLATLTWSSIIIIILKREICSLHQLIFPSHTNLLNRFFVRVEAQQNQNDELLGKMENCGFVGTGEGEKI